MIYSLITYWNADKAYYLGENFDNTQEYQKAYPYLKDAVSLRPGEPVFQDEFAVNSAILAIMVLQQNQKPPTKLCNCKIFRLLNNSLIKQLHINNQLTTNYPNNIIFWKTRVRIFYTLAQADPQYITYALNAIRKAAELAPTDADVSYNLGVFRDKPAISKMQLSLCKIQSNLKSTIINPIMQSECSIISWQLTKTEKW